MIFNRTDRRILERISKQKIDLYLLTFYDIPWKEDPLREGRYSRRRLYDVYKRELERNEFNYREIRGNFFDRAYAAIQAVDQFSRE